MTIGKLSGQCDFGQKGQSYCNQRGQSCVAKRVKVAWLFHQAHTPFLEGFAWHKVWGVKQKKTMAKEQKTIYRVQFKEPPLNDDERTEFFFTSLAAIYDVFTAEQIGCRVNRLYNIGLPDGTPYDGKRCLITQEAIHSKAQKSPFTGWWWKQTPISRFKTWF